MKLIFTLLITNRVISQPYLQGHTWSNRRNTLKLIFLIYGSAKPNIEVSGWLYQTKINLTHTAYQENYQNTPPYFMALSITLFINKNY